MFLFKNDYHEDIIIKPNDPELEDKIKIIIQNLNNFLDKNTHIDFNKLDDEIIWIQTNMEQLFIGLGMLDFKEKEEYIYTVYIYLFIIFIKACTVINKKNSTNVRYVYNNKNFYAFINLCVEILNSEYLKDTMVNKVINKTVLIHYLNKFLSKFPSTGMNSGYINEICIVRKENVEDIIKNINLMFEKLNRVDNFKLINYAFDNFDFFKDLKPWNDNDKIKALNPLSNEKSQDFENYNILDFYIAFILYITNINDFSKYAYGTVNKKKYKNKYDTQLNAYTKQLYTLYESSILDELINGNGITINKLALSVLIKCKKIIWNIPLTDKFSNKTKVLFLNFLVNFEKSIYKSYLETEKSSTIEDLVNKIIEKNLHKKIKYFYDFEYFIKLLKSCFSGNQEEDFIKKEKLNINTIILSFGLDLDEISEDKQNIMNFFIIAYKLLIVNDIYHHFTIIPKNRKKISNLDLENTTIYNKNYISFKRPFDFVRDFNDLIDYYCSIFSSKITKENVNISMASSTRTKIVNSIFGVYDDMILLYFDIFDKTGQIPLMNPKVAEESKKSEKSCLYVSETNSYSKFISSFLNLTKDNSNFIIFDDISIENTANRGTILNYINEKFKENMEAIKEKNCSFLINYNVVNKGIINHASCIVINIKSGYIDNYNCLNILNSSASGGKNYKKIYNEIDYFIDFLFSKILGKDIKPQIYNMFDNMVKMQFELDDFDFNQFCNFYTLIYQFVRLLYFNKKEYTMNYVQEKIIEYFMSFNHLIYFLVVFSFLFVIRCSSIPELYELLFTVKDGKKIFKFREFNEPSEIMFAKYKQILSNTDLIKKINGNINKLFKPLNAKALTENIYNVNLNNNINITDNKNYALQNIQIPELQNNILHNVEMYKKKRIEKEKEQQKKRQEQLKKLREEEKRKQEELRKLKEQEEKKQEELRRIREQEELRKAKEDKKENQNPLYFMPNNNDFYYKYYVGNPNNYYGNPNYYIGNPNNFNKSNSSNSNNSNSSSSIYDSSNSNSSNSNSSNNNSNNVNNSNSQSNNSNSNSDFYYRNYKNNPAKYYSNYGY